MTDLSNSALAQRVSNAVDGWQAFINFVMAWCKSDAPDTVTFTDPYSGVTNTVETPRKILADVNALVGPTNSQLATLQNLVNEAEQMVVDAGNAQTTFNALYAQIIAARDAAINAQTNAALARQAADVDATQVANDREYVDNQITYAEQSATNAATSESHAATSAAAAATSATTASTQAGNAQTSATAAANSATAAANSATSAGTANSQAQSWAAAASTSATNAGISESSASASAAAAAASAASAAGAAAGQPFKLNQFKDVWSPTGTYVVGDVVIYDGFVWSCATAHTASGYSSNITNYPGGAASNTANYWLKMFALAQSKSYIGDGSWTGELDFEAFDYFRIAVTGSTVLSPAKFGATAYKKPSKQKFTYLEVFLPVGVTTLDLTLSGFTVYETDPNGGSSTLTVTGPSCLITLMWPGDGNMHARLVKSSSSSSGGGTPTTIPGALQHIPGRYYPGMLGPIAGGQALTVDQAYLVPFLVPANNDYTELHWAQTGGDAVASLIFGIYADDNGKPGAKLYDSGLVDVGGQWGPLYQPMAVSLTAGICWIAVVAKVGSVSLVSGSATGAFSTGTANAWSLAVSAGLTYPTYDPEFLPDAFSDTPQDTQYAPAIYLKTDGGIVGGGGPGGGGGGA